MLFVAHEVDIAALTSFKFVPMKTQKRKHHFPTSSLFVLVAENFAYVLQKILAK